jgi:hypothetical protein
MTTSTTIFAPPEAQYKLLQLAVCSRIHPVLIYHPSQLQACTVDLLHEYVLHQQCPLAVNSDNQLVLCSFAAACTSIAACEQISPVPARISTYEQLYTTSHTPANHTNDSRLTSNPSNSHRFVSAQWPMLGLPNSTDMLAYAPSQPCLGTCAGVKLITNQVPFQTGSSSNQATLADHCLQWAGPLNQTGHQHQTTSC